MLLNTKHNTDLCIDICLIIELNLINLHKPDLIYAN